MAFTQKNLVYGSVVVAILLTLFCLFSSSHALEPPPIHRDLPNSANSTLPLPFPPVDPLDYIKEQTCWYNDIVLGPFVSHGELQSLPIPHLVQTWLRNYIAALVIYFASAGIWCWYIYHWKKNIYFPQGGIPSREPILLQIWVTMKAMPLYVALPTLSEYMIEKGWTRCFSSIQEVGVLYYAAVTMAYLVLVELGIYWMHRGLHDCKPLYKWLHATHHIYNKENTLSPFAGLAFHPLDGILQACPHVIVIFFLPTHFFTHELLLFVEAFWTTNIHDCIHGKVWPIMGAGYHTIHHTTYKHNYGHYTIWMDWMFGTLRDPSHADKSKKSS